MLRRLAPYILREWKLIGATLAVMLILSAATLVRPWPLQMVVDYVLGSRTAPAWMSSFTDISVKLNILWLAIGLMIASVLLVQMMSLAQTYLSQLLGQKLVFNLRCDLYAKLNYLSLKFHDNKTVGDLIHRITGDAAALQNIVTFGLIPVVVQTFTLLAVMSAVFAMDPRLALISAVSIPFLVFNTLWFSRKVKGKSRNLAEADSALYTKVSESLSSIRAVKAFATEQEEFAHFEERALKSQRNYVTLVTLTSTSGLINELLMGLGTAAVVAMGALVVLQGDLTTGELLVFMAYLPSLYGPTNTLAHSALIIQKSNASVDRVMEILEQPDERAEPGGERIDELNGSIEFEAIEFSYSEPSDELRRRALDGVSLHIDAGQKVALVGRSGSGKTTLLSLLLRFYTPQAGRIMLDGRDIRELDLAWLRRKVALVLQDPILFSSTIAENIAYGRRGATREEIVTASKAAGLDEFIADLPEGYDTQVGERGVRLSGGQRQRISIARAFLKQAPILVMDEPTSSLDATTERQIFEALEELSKNRTTIIVAHRLTTARRADCIVVMQDGMVAEQGTHDALVTRPDSKYARLWLDQTGAEAIPGPLKLAEFGGRV